MTRSETFLALAAFLAGLAAGYIVALSLGVYQTLLRIVCALL